MNSKPQDLKGITRLDQESSGTHGWQVRVQRNGIRYGRFFSDLEWGGRTGALKIAIQYRDRLISHSQRTTQTSSRAHSTTGSRNQSGVIGVTRISQKSSTGVEYHFWQASWTDRDGNRQTVRYSVLKLGEDLAFEQACIARERAIRGKK